MTYPGYQPPAAPPQPAPPQQPAAPVLGFQDPTRGGGGVAPAARHLVGRTVIFVPKSYDPNAKYDGQSRPNAVADLYVVDGGPLTFGDSEDRTAPRPPTHTSPAPAFFPNVMIGNQAIVNEIKSKLGQDGRPTGLSVGVMVKPEGKRYYMLTPCATDDKGRDRPDGEQRKQAAKDLYFAHTSGQWVSPEPTPIGQALPPAGQGVVNYGQPQGAPWQPPAPPAPPQSAPPGAQPLPPTPAWAPHAAQWAAFTPEQQAAIWAQEAPPAAPTGAPGW